KGANGTYLSAGFLIMAIPVGGLNPHHGSENERRDVWREEVVELPRGTRLGNRSLAAVDPTGPSERTRLHRRTWAHARPRESAKPWARRCATYSCSSVNHISIWLARTFVCGRFPAPPSGWRPVAGAPHGRRAVPARPIGGRRLAAVRRAAARPRAAHPAPGLTTDRS